MTVYRRKPESIVADQFDGSVDSAVAITKKYPGRFSPKVGLDDKFAGVLLSDLRIEGPPELKAGDWVVFGNGKLRTFTDAEFRSKYEPEE